MFTGLVESIVLVREFTPIAEGARLSFVSPFSGVSLGDSIAINGCCLTVSAIEGDILSFDILSQTLRVTSLGVLKEGSCLNLERALSAQARFGGHFVSGHIDGVGTVVSLEPIGRDYKIVIALPLELMRYCIDKGSLTLDGISLTIAQLTDASVEFWITPHTWEHTHLSSLALGQKVNIEVDLLAKYVEKLLEPRIRPAS